MKWLQAHPEQFQVESEAPKSGSAERFKVRLCNELQEEEEDAKRAPAQTAVVPMQVMLCILQRTSPTKFIVEKENMDLMEQVVDLADEPATSQCSGSASTEDRDSKLAECVLHQ
eukprot:gene23790-28840_t